MPDNADSRTMDTALLYLQIWMLIRTTVLFREAGQSYCGPTRAQALSLVAMGEQASVFASGCSK